MLSCSGPIADLLPRIELPTAGLWTYFTNDTCRPTTDRTGTCTNGYFPALAIMAKTTAHIKAGVDFAQKNNIRLVIRNTGHDFLGRSVGWGSLVINTHSFKSIKFTDAWTGAGSYNGPAVTVGAGVQARDVLKAANALSPPRIMVTGECITVGVAGGLAQGGGHGPLTNQYGFLADTALEFKVLTADGVFRTANADVNADLFWALRGGGPSSFGVVLEATYKTFADLPSSGINLSITSGADQALFWRAFEKFTGYTNHFIDHGLYVYYEIMAFGPPSLTVQPIVGVNKTSAELAAIVKPLFDDLNALGIRYTTSARTFPTFYQLFMAMFAGEGAGNSALTGGWTFSRTDIATNLTAVVNSFRTGLSNGAFFVGHMWNAGHGLPESEWANSAVHPNFRNAANKLITIVPVSGDAPLSVKAEAQHRMTYIVDQALREAGPTGAAYINEADPFIPDWQDAFWGSNYPRLKTLRQKWDPEGLFYAVSTPGTEEWEQIDYGERLCKKTGRRKH